MKEAVVPDSMPEYVVRTSEGSWRVAGTRISLDSIVHAYWAGQLPEAIATDFPTLSLEQVHGAIAFYLRHRAQIDAYLAEQDARWRQFQHESAQRHNPLMQRIRTADKQAYVSNGGKGRLSRAC